MNNSSAPVLSVSSLQKSYGSHRVLSELHLEVARGAIHGLVGLNGSGKTTTLECILGLQRFDSGAIDVLGFAPARLHCSLGRVIGIFDTPSLNPNLTVRQCLQQARLLCPDPRHQVQEVEEWLGISRFAHYRIKHLSLGNKRRASIAQALLGQPELIILDEPFNGLDAGGVDEVLALIQRLNREQGTSFLLSSHQLPYLEQVCSDIAILHGGTVLKSAPVAELLAQSHNLALLRTPDQALARQVLATMDAVELLAEESGGGLKIQLNSIDSAELNRQLVQQGVPVTELILERASLDSLFRELTREAA